MKKNTNIICLHTVFLKTICFVAFVFCLPVVFGMPTANCQLLDTLTLAQQPTFFSLQEAMLHPDSVFKLTLSKKKLKEIPAQVFTFKNLQILNLSKNSLKEIPAIINQLQNLQDLNLSGNEITAIPASIGTMKNLIHINFNRNLIEAIPPEIGTLQNLEVLEMWDNELDSVPDEIKNLNKLKILELRGILFSKDDQNYLKKLVPDARVYFSPACPCINKF